MALVQSNLTTASTTTDAVSFTTASITPAANALVLAAIYIHVASTDVLPTISMAGNGLTWVQEQISLSSTNARATYLFRAMGGSPTTGTVVISGDGVTFLTAGFWSIVQFTGANTGGTNGSGAIVQSTNLKVSATSVAAAFDKTPNPASGGFGAVGIFANDTISAGSGWTSVSASQAVTGPSTAFMAEYANAACPSSINASWSVSTSGYSVGAEILPASPLTPQLHPPYRAARLARASVF